MCPSMVNEPLPKMHFSEEQLAALLKDAQFAPAPGLPAGKSALEWLQLVSVRA